MFHRFKHLEHKAGGRYGPTSETLYNYQRSSE